MRLVFFTLCVKHDIKYVLYKKGRLLTSPRQAARFVALIPLETRSKIGGAKSDSWASHFSFLAR